MQIFRLNTIATLVAFALIGSGSSLAQKAGNLFPSCVDKNVSELLLRVLNDMPQARQGLFTAKEVLSINAFTTEKETLALALGAPQEYVLQMRENETSCLAFVETNNGDRRVEVTLSWRNKESGQWRLSAQLK
jgi:hypothetical protein